LRTAVSVQPLSFQKVEEYLSTQEKGASGLKNALEQEQGKILHELVTTPLFLKLLILTYHGKSAEELLPLIETASAKEQQHMLFHAYVERVLQKDGPRLHATAQQTKHWLAWLARQLTAHQQSELYLERLQPDWLPKGQRGFYRWSIRLVFGLVFGLLGGLLGGLVFGLVVGLLGGLLVGLVFGLLGGRVFGLLGGSIMKIEPAEALTWSWSWGGLFYGLYFGLVIGLGGGLLAGRVVGLVVGLLGGLVFGLVVGLVVGLVLGLSSKQLTERSMLSPNEGIRRSVKNGFFCAFVRDGPCGLCGGLLGGLAGGLLGGLLGGLAAGLWFGLIFGLGFGLLATVQHYTLRFWLWRTHLFPWQAVPFLDDAVEQLLLRRVGGWYTFRHRLLQDYFASLETPPTEKHHQRQYHSRSQTK
jgi:hypothetical protein